MRRKLFLNFGIPYFDVFDPRYKDFSIPTAVRGSFSVEIKNYKRFLKVNGFDGNTKRAEEVIRNAVIQCVKEGIANLPFEEKIPVWQMERRIDTVSSVLAKKLSARLRSGFDVTLSSLDLTAIEVDEFSEGYQRLSHITRDPIIEHVTKKIESENTKMHSIDSKSGTLRPALIGGGIALAAVGAIAALLIILL